MNPRRQRWLIGILGWIVLSALCDMSVAQPPPSQNTPVPTSKEEPDYTKTLTTLQGILQTTATLQEKLKEKERELQAADTEEQKTKLTAELNDLRNRSELLGRDFESIATGINLETFIAKPRKSFDWKEEIQEVLGPIIEELKKVTARPREIERLRTDVAYYEKRLPIIENALSNIKTIQQQATDKTLIKQLKSLEQIWSERRRELANQLAVAQYHLDETLKEEKPFVESVQGILRTFFKSRGRNLLLAVLAFIVVFLLLRVLYRIINKFSPFQKPQKRTPFSFRVANVLYHLLTFLGATVALLLVLYISGDWVLLGLALIFLFGVIWTAKQGLPLFWEQVKLLLNLSTVRENERVMYNGLPWKVVSLNLYTKLHNPALKGGLIRLPLRDLVTLQSRPFHKDEPWFPSQEEDWVMLADGTFGRVTMQTPEMVQLLLLGGSRKTYPTTGFLQQNPINLSENFRLTVTFGIDYAHQAVSTQEIPHKLAQMLNERLTQEGYGEALLKLEVEFKEAGASSLDLAILADFSGQTAHAYETLKRLLQRLAVDACNRYGWVIPFTQITLHAALPIEEGT